MKKSMLVLSTLFLMVDCYGSSNNANAGKPTASSSNSQGSLRPQHIQVVEIQRGDSSKFDPNDASHAHQSAQASAPQAVSLLGFIQMISSSQPSNLHSQSTQAPSDTQSGQQSPKIEVSKAKYEKLQAKCRQLHMMQTFSSLMEASVKTENAELRSLIVQLRDKLTADTKENAYKNALKIANHPHRGRASYRQAQAKRSHSAPAHIRQGPLTGITGRLCDGGHIHIIGNEEDGTKKTWIVSREAYMELLQANSHTFDTYDKPHDGIDPLPYAANALTSNKTDQKTKAKDATHSPKSAAKK